MGKKEGKNSKKEYNIDKIYKLFKIFLFEIQWFIKKFIKRDCPKIREKKDRPQFSKEEKYGL